MISLKGYEITKEVHRDMRYTLFSGRQLNSGLSVSIIYYPIENILTSNLSQFAFEFNLASQLNSEYVAKLYDFERVQELAGSGLVLIYDEIPGISLKDYINKPKIHTKTDIKKFLTIAIQLASAVNDIHKAGLIYKELKPIIISINPESERIIIKEYAFHTILTRENVKYYTDNYEDTLPYISPEQTGRMNRTVDYRTDLYSLGIILYELLLGEVPFNAKDPAKIIHAHIAGSPVAPIERSVEIPPPISNIILKLISKNPDDRYQSLYGLKYDLLYALKQFNESGFIKDFALAAKDIPEVLQIKKKLYGREKELNKLILELEKNITERPKAIFVTGYSGVGKSSLIYELHQPIIKKGAHYISGKYNFQSNVPYSAIIQALQEFVKQILTQSSDKIYQWKSRLLNNLKSNIDIIIDIIPELELITGIRHTPADTTLDDTHSRFNLTFENFIKSISDETEPLVMFLDDLQWADAASLDIISSLLSSQSLRSFVLLGSYRETEVTEEHPLQIMIQELKNKNIKIDVIPVGPLSETHVRQIVHDSFIKDTEKAHALARIIYDMTGGNPLFIRQFLNKLCDEKILYFDYDNGIWKSEIEKINAKDIVGDVVDLMHEKIIKLHTSTQELLQLAACIGNRFELKLLSTIAQKTPEEVAGSIWEATEQGLVIPGEDTYAYLAEVVRGEKDINNAKFSNTSAAFLHDKVQQALYSMIPEENKKELHLKIGRMLLKNLNDEEKEDQIFDIVNQINFGKDLITCGQEKIDISRLNLMAGKKAKTSAAFLVAYSYYKTGISSLDFDAWQTQYNLILELYKESTEAAYLISSFNEMNLLADIVLKNAVTTIDKIKIYELKIKSLIAQKKYLESVDTGIQVLKMLGIKIPSNPGKYKVLSIWLHKMLLTPRTYKILKQKNIEKLLELPDMTDNEILAAVEILSCTITASYIANPYVSVLLIIKLFELSIKFGNAPESCVAYISYAVLLCGTFGNITMGYEVGKLALQISQKGNYTKYYSRINFVFNTFIKFWKFPIREMLSSFIDIYYNCIESGDIEYASYSLYIYCDYSLFAGVDLIFLEREFIKYSQIVNQLKHETPIHYLEIAWQATLNLLGKSDNTCRLKGQIYDEDLMLQRHISENDRTGLFNLYYFKFWLSYLFGDHKEAVKLSYIVEEYIDGAASTIGMPLFAFYESMNLLSVYSESANNERSKYYRKTLKNLKKLNKWAEHSPENNKNKCVLLEAELASVLGNITEAARLYDEAIKLSNEYGLIHEEALAYECAAKFYLVNEKEKIAGLYMHDAFIRYEKWGAAAKADDLKNKYQLLLQTGKESSHFNSETALFNKQQISFFDVDTILKSTQTISSEIELNKLIQKAVKILVETACAERGVLILKKKNVYYIEAEWTINKDDVSIFTSIPLDTNTLHQQISDIIPVSIINYITRTEQALVLNDARNNSLFNSDIYIERLKPKSILAMPILHKAKTIGILYLENNLSQDVFTPDRLEMLKILSTQAAISFENAMLYEDIKLEINERIKAEKALKTSEERYRLLAENVTDVILTLNMNLELIYISPSCVTLRGYTPEETLQQDLAGILSPANYQSVVELFTREKERVYDGSFKSIILELEISRKDGSTVMTESIISIIYDVAKKPQYILVITRDITERKKAEDEIKKFKTIADNANYGVSIINLKGDIVYINRYLKELYGYPYLENLPKTNIAGFIQDKDKTILTELLTDLQTKGSYVAKEIRSKHKNGYEICQLSSGVLIRDKNGEPLFIGITTLDITEIKKAQKEQMELEKKLQQAQKMEALGTLAGGLAHDFNNLLMAMQGNLSLILMDINKTNSHFEKLNNIEEYIKSGSNLTKQLLGFARGGKYEVKPVNINALIKKTADMFIRTQKEITLVEKYDANVMPVEVDQVQIEQVLLNLYINALRAMPGGGNLFIQTSETELDQDFVKPYNAKPGKYAKISITDTGVGMDEITMQRMFEPFFTTNEMGRGTGLGLASAYGIIQNHNGIINVYSEKEKGTTISIYLPATEKAVSSIKPVSKNIIRGDEKILLVDDEAMILNIARQMLDKLGYKVESVSSGITAVELITSGKVYDLVILDMIMPGMSGSEAFDLIRALNPKIKVLLSSGYSIDGQASAILERGCNGFIQKPFNIKELSIKIREVLNKREC